MESAVRAALDELYVESLEREEITNGSVKYTVWRTLKVDPSKPHRTVTCPPETGPKVKRVNGPEIRYDAGGRG